MTRNWVMKLLTVCIAASALVFLYSAYHAATFLLSFPDSATLRWADRYTEVFPTFAVVPRAFFQLTGNALLQFGNATRWPGILLQLLLAAASGVLVFGLARYRKWARAAFGTMAAAFGLLQLFKLSPLVLHLFAGGVRSSLAGLAEERVGPLYTLFGIIVSAGCSWLIWRWRDEPEQETRPAPPVAATKAPAVSAVAESIAAARSAREQAKRARLRRSIRWIQISEALIAAAIVLGAIPGTSVSVALLSLHIGVAVIWFLLLALIWYLLTREEPRLGIGMAVGFGVLQFLPYIAISMLPYPAAMLYLLGGQGLGSLVVAVLPSLGALFMSIAAVRATIQAGKPTAQLAGRWGVGVLAVLLGALINSQVAQESTYAKSPPMSRERESQQSEEYQRGHAAQQGVLAIGKCVFQYAATHPSEGFPEKLDEIGPVGNGCFADVNAVAGHAFLYESSGSAGMGARDRFIARSKQTEHIGSTFSLPDEMVDESGILAAVEGEKRGFAFSPALVLTKNVGDCLKIAFDASGGDTYPADLHGLLSIKAQYGVPCVQPYEAKDLSVLELWRNKFSYQFYKFEYQPTNAASGKYKGFELAARPQEYGKKALRSYFMDESGVVRATPQDRAAKAEDTDARCEFQQKDCTIAAISADETPK
jgi:hypothetical protein